MTNRTSWEPEQEESQPKLEYQVSCHVALEDSDTQTWGMVKDTEGSFTWKPGGGALVGKWSRSPMDGLIHVFLETPIMALVDKATQKFAEYAEARKLGVTKASRAPRVPRAPKEPEEPSESMQTISDLRKLLKG